MSQSFYDLSVADLQRAQIPSDTISRIVAQYAQASQAGQFGVNIGYDSKLEPIALLAYLIKINQRDSVRYNVYSYKVPGGTSAVNPARIAQVLPQNPNRKILIIQINNSASPTNSAQHLLFQEESLIPRLLNAQATAIYKSRGININKTDATTKMRPFWFTPGITDAVSILCSTWFATGTGLIIEGV